MESTLLDFQSGVGSLHSLLDNLLLQVQKEKEGLQKAKEALEQDRRQFEEECQRIQQVYCDSEQVILNVGGSKFTTTVTTLKNAPSPSLFNAMFSGRHKLKADDSGCYFIDRDGRHFHDILNYLRDGQLTYPVDGTDFKYLLELRAEAEFYGLVGLVNQIDRFPYSVTVVTRAATLNTEDSWMYEDGQDEVVITVDRQCQLLGVGLCGTEGGLTIELEVYQVDPEDYSNEICTLQSVAQTFTKVDGDILKLYFPSPAILSPEKYYMLSGLIKGTESYCCEDCLETVIAGGVKVHFHKWESPNGTNEQRGQFPELYIRAL